MDDLDLYEDLDQFQEQEEKKSKELQDAECKYQESLKTIQGLEEENKILKKKIQRIELSFQSLLDTARNEIRRKDAEIERLRKEKDDICFRRKLPNRTKEMEGSDTSQPLVRNPFSQTGSTTDIRRSSHHHHHTDLPEKSDHGHTRDRHRSRYDTEKEQERGHRSVDSSSSRERRKEERESSYKTNKRDTSERDYHKEHHQSDRKRDKTGNNRESSDNKRNRYNDEYQRDNRDKQSQTKHSESSRNTSAERKDRAGGRRESRDGADREQSRSKVGHPSLEAANKLGKHRSKEMYENDKTLPSKEIVSVYDGTHVFTESQPINRENELSQNNIEKYKDKSQNNAQLKNKSYSTSDLNNILYDNLDNDFEKENSQENQLHEPIIVKKSAKLDTPRKVSLFDALFGPSPSSCSTSGTTTPKNVANDIITLSSSSSSGNDALIESKTTSPSEYEETLKIVSSNSKYDKEDFDKCFVKNLDNPISSGSTIDLTQTTAMKDKTKDRCCKDIEVKEISENSLHKSSSSLSNISIPGLDLINESDKSDRNDFLKSCSTSRDINIPGLNIPSDEARVMKTNYQNSSIESKKSEDIVSIVPKTNTTWHSKTSTQSTDELEIIFLEDSPSKTENSAGKCFENYEDLLYGDLLCDKETNAPTSSNKTQIPKDSVTTQGPKSVFNVDIATENGNMEASKCSKNVLNVKKKTEMSCNGDLLEVSSTASPNTKVEMSVPTNSNILQSPNGALKASEENNAAQIQHSPSKESIQKSSDIAEFQCNKTKPGLDISSSDVEKCVSENASKRHVDQTTNPDVTCVLKNSSTECSTTSAACGSQESLGLAAIKTSEVIETDELLLTNADLNDSTISHLVDSSTLTKDAKSRTTTESQSPINLDHSGPSLDLIDTPVRTSLVKNADILQLPTNKNKTTISGIDSDSVLSTDFGKEEGLICQTSNDSFMSNLCTKNLNENWMSSPPRIARNQNITSMTCVDLTSPEPVSTIKNMKVKNSSVRSGMSGSDISAPSSERTTTASEPSVSFGNICIEHVCVPAIKRLELDEILTTNVDTTVATAISSMKTPEKEDMESEKPASSYETVICKEISQGNESKENKSTDECNSTVDVERKEDRRNSPVGNERKETNSHNKDQTNDFQSLSVSLSNSSPDEKLPVKQDLKIIEYKDGVTANSNTTEAICSSKDAKDNASTIHNITKVDQSNRIQNNIQIVPTINTSDVQLTISHENNDKQFNSNELRVRTPCTTPNTSQENIISSPVHLVATATQHSVSTEDVQDCAKPRLDKIQTVKESSKESISPCEKIANEVVKETETNTSKMDEEIMVSLENGDKTSNSVHTLCSTEIQHSISAELQSEDAKDCTKPRFDRIETVKESSIGTIIPCEKIVNEAVKETKTNTSKVDRQIMISLENGDKTSNSNELTIHTLCSADIQHSIPTEPQSETVNESSIRTISPCEKIAIETVKEDVKLDSQKTCTSKADVQIMVSLGNGDTEIQHSVSAESEYSPLSPAEDVQDCVNLKESFTATISPCEKIAIEDVNESQDMIEKETFTDQLPSNDLVCVFNENSNSNSEKLAENLNCRILKDETSKCESYQSSHMSNENSPKTLMVKKANTHFAMDTDILKENTKTCKFPDDKKKTQENFSSPMTEIPSHSRTPIEETSSNGNNTSLGEVKTVKPLSSDTVTEYSNKQERIPSENENEVNRCIENQNLVSKAMPSDEEISKKCPTEENCNQEKSIGETKSLETSTKNVQPVDVTSCEAISYKEDVVKVGYPLDKTLQSEANMLAEELNFTEQQSMESINTHTKINMLCEENCNQTETKSRNEIQQNENHLGFNEGSIQSPAKKQYNLIEPNLCGKNCNEEKKDVEASGAVLKNNEKFESVPQTADADEEKDVEASGAVLKNNEKFESVPQNADADEEKDVEASGSVLKNNEKFESVPQTADVNENINLVREQNTCSLIQNNIKANKLLEELQTNSETREIFVKISSNNENQNLDMARNNNTTLTFNKCADANETKHHENEITAKLNRLEKDETPGEKDSFESSFENAEISDLEDLRVSEDTQEHINSSQEKTVSLQIDNKVASLAPPKEISEEKLDISPDPSKTIPDNNKNMGAESPSNKPELDETVKPVTDTANLSLNESNKTKSNLISVTESNTDIGKIVNLTAETPKIIPDIQIIHHEVLKTADSLKATTSFELSNINKVEELKQDLKQPQEFTQKISNPIEILEKQSVKDPKALSKYNLQQKRIIISTAFDSSTTIKSGTDSYNDASDILPSVSTKCPTPYNFSGIFSKQIHDSHEDLLKSKKKSPKPKEYVLPAASVLCTMDNLENATKSACMTNKKLHWEMLENKNNSEIEDDSDADSSDDDKITDIKKQDDESLPKESIDPTDDLRCLETLKSTDNESEENKRINALESGKKSIARRNTIDTVPINQAVSYYKELEERQSDEQLPLALSKQTKTKVFNEDISIKSRKRKAKLIESSPIRVRSAESLMDSTLIKVAMIKRRKLPLCLSSKAKLLKRMNSKDQLNNSSKEAKSKGKKPKVVTNDDKLEKQKAANIIGDILSSSLQEKLVIQANNNVNVVHSPTIDHNTSVSNDGRSKTSLNILNQSNVGFNCKKSILELENQKTIDIEKARKDEWIDGQMSPEKEKNIVKDNVTFKTPTKKITTINSGLGSNDKSPDYLDESPNTSIIYDKEYSSDEQNSCPENSEPECNKYLKDKMERMTNSNDSPQNDIAQKENGCDIERNTEKALKSTIAESVRNEKPQEKSLTTVYKIPKLKKTDDNNTKNLNSTKKEISLHDIGIKTCPFKGHLSSFRIPKIKRETAKTSNENTVTDSSSSTNSCGQNVILEKTSSSQDSLKKTAMKSRRKSINIVGEYANSDDVLSTTNKTSHIYNSLDQTSSSLTSRNASISSTIKVRRKSVCSQSRIRDFSSEEGVKDVCIVVDKAKSSETIVDWDQNCASNKNDPRGRRKSVNLEKNKSIYIDKLDHSSSSEYQQNIEDVRCQVNTVKDEKTIRRRRKSTYIEETASSIELSKCEENQNMKNSTVQVAANAEIIHNENTNTNPCSSQILNTGKPIRQRRKSTFVENTMPIETNKSLEKQAVQDSRHRLINLTHSSEETASNDISYQSTKADKSVRKRRKSIYVDNITSADPRIVHRDIDQSNSSNAIQILDKEPIKSVGKCRKSVYNDESHSENIVKNNSQEECTEGGNKSPELKTTQETPTIIDHNQQKEKPKRMRRKSVYAESNASIEAENVVENNNKANNRVSSKAIGKRRKSIAVDKQISSLCDECPANNTHAVLAGSNKSAEPIKQIKVRRKSMAVDRISLYPHEKETTDINTNQWTIVNVCKDSEQLQDIEKSSVAVNKKQRRKSVCTTNDCSKSEGHQNIDTNSAKKAGEFQISDNETKSAKTPRISRKSKQVEKCQESSINSTKQNELPNDIINSKIDKNYSIEEDKSLSKANKELELNNAGRNYETQKILKIPRRSLYTENLETDRLNKTPDVIIKPSCPKDDSDSEASNVVGNINSTKLRRRSINLQRRILDSSSDSETETPKPESTTTLTIPVISSNKDEIISSSNPPTEKKCSPPRKKRRVVKVISTTYDDEPGINKKSNTALEEAVVNSNSPNYSHSIFHTSVRDETQSDINNMTPLSHDDRFHEIDTTMQNMFYSPQHEAVAVADLKSQLCDKSINQDNSISLSLTIDETARSTTTSESVVKIGETTKDLQESYSLNTTTSTSSSLSHNQSSGDTTKHVTLGTSEYRFEKVSENVVNLFISRKRKRKPNN